MISQGVQELLREMVRRNIVERRGEAYTLFMQGRVKVSGKTVAQDADPKISEKVKIEIAE